MLFTSTVILLLVLVLAWLFTRPHGGTTALGLGPSVVWYLDDSQVNARQWDDWGNRATRSPNSPYLAIELERAKKVFGSRLRPIVGREEFLALLGPKGPVGSNLFLECPQSLFMAWSRAAYLAAFGGMWMDGSVLLLSTTTDVDAHTQGADVVSYGPSAGSAARPAHPVWTGIADDLAARINAGPQSWSPVEIERIVAETWTRHSSGVTGVRTDTSAALTADDYGRRLELETILEATEWPAGHTATTKALWVPWPGGLEGLERASRYQWFTRMSREQIQESKFMWAQWAFKSGRINPS